MKVKVPKYKLLKIIKEEQVNALIEHELRKMKRIDEGKMEDLAKRFGVPLALVTAIAAGIEAPTSVDIPAEAPGVEQTVDAPEETEEKGGLRINPETGGYEYVKYAHMVEDPPEDTGDEIDMDSLKYRAPPLISRTVVNKESKMKISKSKLIQMIKEEMIKEDDEWVDVSKLKSQAEHGPYAEDEFKKDMETTLSRVVSDELSFEEAMEEFNGFLDQYVPSEDPWDKYPDPEAFSFDEDDLYSGPETPEGRVPGPPEEEETIEVEGRVSKPPEEEETIEVTDDEEPVRTTTPTGATHRRLRGQQRTTGAKLSPETLRMLRKK